MKPYLRRLIKFLLFLIVLFFLLLFALPWITKGASFGQSFTDFTGNPRIRILLILIFIYTLLYPLLNFGKKDRHLNGSFSDNRPAIEKTMKELGYEKKAEEYSTLVYRKKTAIARVMMLGEDRVEIEARENPLIFNGPKRDLKRIDRMLDTKLLKES
jgi:hypothetical protein